MIKIEGSFVAVATPYRGGKVDLPAVRDLVDFHLRSGTNGICPVATTGESPVLSTEEKAEVIRTVVKMARGKMIIAPGTGSNNTAGSIEMTKMAKDLRADAALLVTPYYNKPTQEGLYQHFSAIAKATRLPQILYNVPSRTGVHMTPETIARLFRKKEVVAVKEASGSLDQISEIRNLCEIAILSGEDSLTYPILALGGKGVISVAANIIPKQIAQMCAAALKGDFRKAQKIHLAHYHLFKTLFVETNPIPVKTALKMMGYIEAEFRLPLTSMTPKGITTLRRVLKAHRLV